MAVFPVLPVFPFGAVVHKQRQIVALFRAAGATSSNRATTAATLAVQEGLAFRILLSAVVREVGEQRVYLDESSWESHQKKRRRLAFIIPGLVLLCLALTAGIVFWGYSPVLRAQSNRGSTTCLSLDSTRCAG